MYWLGKVRTSEKQPLRIRLAGGLQHYMHLLDSNSNDPVSVTNS